MSNVRRIFLEAGGAKDHNGSGVNLGFSFTSERDLDEHLWHDPETAVTDLKFLLKVHQGEMTPALSRLALKGVTMPLFEREFYGEETPFTVDQEVTEIPERNSRLLDAYLDRVGDEDIDQLMLKQAIDDATVLQLVSRSLRSEATDDIILLPAGPEEDQSSRPASFTVLRRKSLGRALLYVSSVRPDAYDDTPEANQHRIQIRPTDLWSGGANRFDLAEALIAEQQNTIISIEDDDLIQSASAHVHDTIAQHFDTIEPLS